MLRERIKMDILNSDETLNKRDFEIVSDFLEFNSSENFDAF